LGKCTIAEHSAGYARASPPPHSLRAASFRTCSSGRSTRGTRSCARSSASPELQPLAHQIAITGTGWLGCGCCARCAI